MTHTANSRLAGFAFLIYIATGITTMVISPRIAGAAADGAARLAAVAQHELLARAMVLLMLPQFASAVVLGVTLYALTRAVDRDLALLALCCRLVEGALGAFATVRSLGEVMLATGARAAADPVALGAALEVQRRLDGGMATIAATCFAVGSLIFSWLFLRARSIPRWLAWLGVAASALLVLALPLNIAGLLRGAVNYYVWIPMAVFEIVFAVWLIAKGVQHPSKLET